MKKRKVKEEYVARPLTEKEWERLLDLLRQTRSKERHARRKRDYSVDELEGDIEQVSKAYAWLSQRFSPVRQY